jgi:hypothetical protein
MLPMDNEIAIENIRRYISPSTCHENIFDKDELEYIWKSAFCDIGKARLNRNGTVLIAGHLLTKKMYTDFKEKIDKLIPYADLSPKVGGNYFITPQQYGLHNDSIRPEDWENTTKIIPKKDYRRRYTCYKNIIIPLWIGSHLDELDGGQIVFFDQRHIDWAHVYNGGGLVPNIASVYKIATDYSDIQFYDGKGNPQPKENNSIPFDKEFHEKWMNTPYQRLQGLTVENCFNWVPGSPCVFDAVQLHATNRGTPHGEFYYNAKMGLLLTFLVELDDDLKEEWFLNDV